MKFGCFFVGQRPQLHEQYADERKVNPNPVRRTDVEVYEDILKGAMLAEEVGFDSVWVAEHAFSEHSIVSSPHSMRPRPNGSISAWHVQSSRGIPPCEWLKTWPPLTSSAKAD